MTRSTTGRGVSPPGGLVNLFEGMACVFDIAGAKHPGNDQHPDPWVAAREDIADAWRETGELLGWAIEARAGHVEPVEPTP